MMAVGGLPAEMVVHMLVSTRMPPQYGKGGDVCRKMGNRENSISRASQASIFPRSLEESRAISMSLRKFGERYQLVEFS